MDLHTQYIRALMVSISFFCIGIALIELASTRFIAWCGRATVLCSISVLGFFGWFAVEEFEKVTSQLSAMKHHESFPLAEPGTKIASIPPESSGEIVTESGTVITWGESDAGRTRSVSTADRRIRRLGSVAPSDRGGILGVRRDWHSAGDGTDGVPNAKSNASWTGHRNDSGGSKTF